MERSPNKATKKALETGFWGPESKVHLPGFATPFLYVSSSNLRLGTERNSYRL